MNKPTKALFLALLTSLVLAACGNADAQANDLLKDIKERGYLLVSTDPNFKPQSWLNHANRRPANTRCPLGTLTALEMQGFDVEVAKAIGDHLGVETCFSVRAWDAIVTGNWAGEWDISVGSMSITTARQQVLDFSLPYYYSPAIVAIRADAGLTSLEGLSDQALCVGTATTYEAWLEQDDLGPAVTVFRKAPENIKIITLDTDQRCPKSIIAGRPDFIGYVTSEIVVDSNIADGMPVKKLEGPVFYERLAAAFDKASSLSTATLRVEVDKLFAQMHSDGTLSELSRQWFKDQNGQGIDYTVEPE